MLKLSVFMVLPWASLMIACTKVMSCGELQLTWIVNSLLAPMLTCLNTRFSCGGAIAVGEGVSVTDATGVGGGVGVLGGVCFCEFRKIEAPAVAITMITSERTVASMIFVFIFGQNSVSW